MKKTRRTIRLKRGETRSFLCGDSPRSHLHVVIHSHDNLIVTCRKTQEVIRVECARGTARRHFLVIPKNTRVFVTCRR